VRKLTAPSKCWRTWCPLSKEAP